MSAKVVRLDCQGAIVLNESVTTPVFLTLRYEKADPFAVSVDFHEFGSSHTTTWKFARTLLEDGLVNPVGDGDVRIVPDPGEEFIALMLSSPDGAAQVRIPWDVTATFLDQTVTVVPAGQEQIDWDGVIGALLDAG